MSLERMSVGAATAGVALLAASVALGVSAWPGVALLVLATVAAGAQAALDQINEGIVSEEAQGLENRIGLLEHRLEDIDGKGERRIERLGLKCDELAADMEAIKRRSALNSL